MEELLKDLPPETLHIMLGSGDKKYKNFTELYRDYQYMIDAEFEKRHLYRLTELKTSLENREKYAAQEISGLKNHEENDKARWKLHKLDEIYQAVVKEMTLKIPDMSLVDKHINSIKNHIVDILSIDSFRGKPEYRIMLRRAGAIADLVENAMKVAYYDSNRFNMKMLNDVYSEELIKHLNRRIETMENDAYNSWFGAFRCLLDVMDKIPEEERDKVLKKMCEDCS